MTSSLYGSQSSQALPSIIRLLPLTEHGLYYVFKGAAKEHNVEGNLITLRPVVRARFNTFRPLAEPARDGEGTLSCDVALFRSEDRNYFTIKEVKVPLAVKIVLNLPAGEGTKAMSRAVVFETDSKPLTLLWQEMKFLEGLEFKTRKGIFQSFASA